MNEVDELAGLGKAIQYRLKYLGFDSRGKIEAAVLSGVLHPRAKQKIRWYERMSHAEVCKWLGVNFCPHCKRPIK